MTTGILANKFDRLEADSEPTILTARRDRPAVVRPEGTAMIATARANAPEADLEPLTHTARQHRLAELSLADMLETTAMARPKAQAVA